MGVMEQPVHGCGGKEGVREDSRELIDVAIRRDDEGATLVALADDLVEVERLLATERSQPEIVDHENVNLREALQAPLVGAIATTCTELTEELLGEDVLSGVSRSAGAIGECLCQVALPQAGLTDEDEVLGPSHELAGGRIDDLCLGDLGIELEVEVLDGEDSLEAGATDSLVELLGVAAVGLVLEE